MNNALYLFGSTVLILLIYAQWSLCWKPLLRDMWNDKCYTKGRHKMLSKIFKRKRNCEEAQG